MGLRITATADTRINLAWDEAVDNGSVITGYNLERRVVGGDWVAVPFAGTGTTYAITGLMSNTDYEFRIQSENSVGVSNWSPPVKGTTSKSTGVPDEMNTPIITNITGSTAIANWVAPASNMSPIRDYEIRYVDTFNRIYIYLAADADDTMRMLTALNNNRTYNLQMRAGNAQGYGDWSDPAEFSTSTSTTPSEPLNVHTTMKTGMSFSIAWDTPLDNGGRQIEGYVVEYKTSEETEYTIQSPVVIRRAIISGLEAEETYNIRVKAFNNLGDGRYSTVYTDVTTTAVPGQMAAPRIIDNTLDQDSVQLIWAQPLVNFIGIDDYDLRYRHTDSETVYVAVPHDGIATTSVVTGLIGSTTYRFSVRAGNTFGEGDWSNELVFTTPAATGTPSRPAMPTLVTRTSDDFTFAWLQPATVSPILAYQYRWRGRNDGVWQTVNHATLITQATIANLQANELYEVQVNARNVNGTSFWSPSLMVVTTVAQNPSDPTDLTVGVIEGNSVALSWQAGDDGGSAIIRWGVEYRDQHDTVWQIFNYIGVAPSVIVSGLAPATLFQFRVRAFNQVGNSDYSNVVNAETLTTAGPDAPVLSLVPNTINDMGAQVQWTEPNNNGSEIVD